MKIPLISLTLGLAFLLASLPAGAQSTPLTLRDAVALSLRQSHQLQGDQAQVSAAQARLRQVEMARYPSVNVSGNYLLANSPNISGNIIPQEGGGFGGDDILQVAYGQVSASLPVYVGGKFRYSIESAKYLEKAAQLNVEKDRQEIILNSIYAYCNLYKARKLIDLVQENLRESRNRVKDFSNLEQNGLLARNDLLNAQLQQSRVELSLLDAENDYSQAALSMQLLLGLKTDQEITLDSNSFATPVFKIKSEEAEAISRENRLEFDILEQQKQASRQHLLAIRSEQKPTVAVSASYLSAWAKDLLVLGNAVNLGVGVRYNVASLWDNKSKREEVQAQLLEQESREAQLQDRVLVEVHAAVQKYELDQHKIGVYQRALDHANENYRIVKNKFDNGLATTQELLDSDTARLQATLNHSFSRIDAVASYYALLKAEGRLSENLAPSF